jgi:general secretion pathway protein G
MNKKMRGFTLIEIMIVVVILGILGAVVVPQLMDKPDKARVVKAKQDIMAIESALDLYKLDKFNYPTTEQGLEALQPKYIKQLNKDPWDRAYLYLSPGEHGAVDIYTYGADGKKGGEGMDADLGNWALEEDKTATP